ncbi:hypothetical protein JCM10213_002216 [Rhodosporidiobolus nylandii]
MLSREGRPYLPYSTLVASLDALPLAVSEHSAVTGETLAYLHHQLLQFRGVVEKRIPTEHAWRELAFVSRWPAGPRRGEGKTYQAALLNAVKAVSAGIRLGNITTGDDVDEHIRAFERTANAAHEALRAVSPAERAEAVRGIEAAEHAEKQQTLASLARSHPQSSRSPRLPLSPTCGSEFSLSSLGHSGARIGLRAQQRYGVSQRALEEKWPWGEAGKAVW